MEYRISKIQGVQSSEQFRSGHPTVTVTGATAAEVPTTPPAPGPIPATTAAEEEEEEAGREEGEEDL